MFSRISNTWNERGFELLLSSVLIILLLYGIYRKLRGKKGTWNLDLKNMIEPVNHWSNYKKDKMGNKFCASKSASLDTPGYRSMSKGEAYCKLALEKIFKKPFNKARPDFLRNPVTGKFNLELDCFNSELGIAAEYNGIQHYRYTPFFHKNYEAFMNQKYRDEIKRRMCFDNGICLLEVPYTVSNENIESFIRQELVKKGKM